jgi:hypothetical protein
MVLDIQTVHHILKNTAVQNEKQTVCLHYGLDFHFNLTILIDVERLFGNISMVRI